MWCFPRFGVTCNLKNVKNTHGGVLLLVKLQASLKVTLLHEYLSRFLNCTNGTKSRNASWEYHTQIKYRAVFDVNLVLTPCNITYFQLKFLFLSWSDSLLLELAFHIFHHPICSRLWSLTSLFLLCCTLSSHLLVRICHSAWWGETCYHHLSSYTMILASWVWHIHWHWQLHQNLLLTYIMLEDLLWPLKEKAKTAHEKS